MELDSTYPELTTLKVVYNGLARRVKVPYDMEWNDFEHKVCRLFNISPPLVTSYKDSMGVSVIVDNSDDFFFFLDEEYTGRLDIVTNIEASEASDWTVVRTDTGKALKELDRSSEVSLSDNQSEKSKTGSGIVYPGSASSVVSSHNHSLGPEKIPSIPPDSPSRVLSLEAPQLSSQSDSLSEAVGNAFTQTEEATSESSPVKGNTRLTMVSDSVAQSSKFTPVMRFSKSPISIGSPESDKDKENALFPKDAQAEEDSIKTLQKGVESESLSSPRDIVRNHSTHALSETSGLETGATSKAGFNPEEQGDDRGLVTQDDHNENISEKLTTTPENTPPEENKANSDAIKEQIENSSPIAADFHEFAEALVSNLFRSGSFQSNPELAPVPHVQASNSSMDFEPSDTNIAAGQRSEEGQETQEAEAPEPSSPVIDEFARLKKGQDLRTLCYKFDEAFRCHPSLLTTIELFTDQITHGVPINLEILENGLRRLAPLPRESHPRVLDAASNLVGSVGSMINHVGSSISSLIENDISKFLLPNARASKYESRDANSHASQHAARHTVHSDEESPEARKCHRRSHRHGCNCLKKHRSGQAENEDSPAAEDIYKGRCHHRRHGRKRKSHVCSLHRLDSAAPSEKFQPESTSKPEAENFASSFTAALPTIAVCPPKLAEIASRSKISQSFPSPPKDYSHFSILADGKRNCANPFSTSPKSGIVDDNVERSRRPYSLKSLIMSPDVEPYVSAPYNEPIKPSRDLGQEINPADVALISGIVALRDMGFHDDAANLDALQAHFGRLEDAIEELLKF